MKLLYEDNDELKASVFEATKKYFWEIGVSMNNAQLRNAVSCVCCFLLDEDLLLEVVLRSLYPEHEFKKEAQNDEKGEEED